jgi:hypothetical protein
VDDLVELPAFGPGLHVQTDAQPSVRAQQLADALDGHLCTSRDEADRLLDDLTSVPPLPADALAVLGALADRVRAAERIVERTVDRAAEEVGERLAATGTGMAVHPSAVRDRAASVLAAREAAATAEERLRVGQIDADEARAAAAEALAARPDRSSVASTVDEPPARRRRFFSFRRTRATVQDTRESTSLLQQMAAATDEAFGQRVAATARDDNLLLLRAQRDRAMEDVRVAERAWRSLAGDDPVEDVEAVVRRFDPQHQDALAVAQETVGVRAVSALLTRALERWQEGWRAYGFEQAAVAPGAMPSIVERGGKAIVLAGGAVERAEAIAAAAPAAPVVTVEPAGELAS